MKQKYLIEIDWSDEDTEILEESMLRYVYDGLDDNGFTEVFSVHGQEFGEYSGLKVTEVK